MSTSNRSSAILRRGSTVQMPTAFSSGTARSTACTVLTPSEPSFLLVINSLTPEVRDAAARTGFHALECSPSDRTRISGRLLSLASGRGGIARRVAPDSTSNLARRTGRLFSSRGRRQVPRLRSPDMIVADTVYPCFVRRDRRGIVLSLTADEVRIFSKIRRATASPSSGQLIAARQKPRSSSRSSPMPTVPLQANNRIWLTYKHFPYKPWNAVAELVDNSVQSYLDNKRALNKQLKADKEHFSVRIDHAKEELFSIWDNAMGDGPRRPQSRRPARPSAAEHKGRSEFGMGMKTSCCWLGGRWTIVAKKLGTQTEYSVTIDVEEIAASDSHELPVRTKRRARTSTTLASRSPDARGCGPVPNARPSPAL